MGVSQADKSAEFVSYAIHCLRIAERLPDRESRVMQREMAAEWLKLAGHAVEQDVALRAQATIQAKKYG
jgi:hypothetical protein